MAGPGALLAAAGLIITGILKHVYQGWMWVGHIMGWVNTRIIFGILFYGVVTPMGLVMKLTGRDPMRKEFEPASVVGIHERAKKVPALGDYAGAGFAQPWYRSFTHCSKLGWLQKVNA